MAPAPMVAVASDYFSIEAAEVPKVPLVQGLSTSLILIALLAIAEPLAARFLDRVVKCPSWSSRSSSKSCSAPACWGGSKPPI